MRQWLEKNEEKKNNGVDVLGQQFQAQVLRMKYENKANEQFSRRESVKIFGIIEQGLGTIKEEKDEDTEALC